MLAEKKKSQVSTENKWREI